MRADQQHAIRNGTMAIFYAARRIERCGGLSPEQLGLVGSIQKQCCRIGRSIGMSGLAAAERARRKRMKRTVLLMVCIMGLIAIGFWGCATLSATTPAEKANAACTDLAAIAGTTRLFVTASQPLIPPDRQGYVQELLPALDRVDAGVAGYCEAAKLATSTESLTALAAQAKDVQDLAGYVWTAIYGARFNAVSQSTGTPWTSEG